MKTDLATHRHKQNN